MRDNIAQVCNEKYGMHVSFADINDCDGCKAVTGRLFSGCINCAIRICGLDRSIENCAYCSEFICNKLKKMFTDEPETQERLEEIRRKIGNVKN